MCEFIFVDDIVEGLCKVVMMLGVVGEIINFGVGDEIKIVDLVNKIFEFVGFSSCFLFGVVVYCEVEIWWFVVVIEKVKCVLNWFVMILLEDGFIMMIVWYCNCFCEVEFYFLKLLGF